MPERKPSPTLGETVDPHGRTSAPELEGEGGHVYKPGDRVGRYEILGRLGEGGMAVVYSARDQQLGRNIAIKVLHSALSQHMDRLVREAQAMAQLSHPNVVTVYEVGINDGQIFICLELVRGSTLGQWLHAEPRAQRDVLATFVAAGRGLEAAHKTRIVHRDFKPDNVLIDGSGRARVTDFGIARDMAEPGGASALEHGSTLPDLSSLRTPMPLTATGALMGTPNYMAPELFSAATADARSDQYAYCVALYEALCGQLPFTATTLPLLIEKVTGGKRDACAAERKLPRWLRSLLLRGMSRDPAQRFESMTALLAELERDRGAIVRRVAAVTLSVTALGLGAALLLRDDKATTPACGTEDRLVGVWDSSRRANMEKAFRQTGLPHAEASLKAAVGELDAYAAAWSAMNLEVCEAALVRKEQSSELSGVRSLCLEKRRGDLARAVSLLERPDPVTLARADDMISSLDSIAQCANASELLQVVPPPSDPTSKETISKVEASLSEAGLQLELGKFDRANTLLEDAERALGGLDYAPLRAHLLDLHGKVDLRRGKFASAERYLLEAVAAAERGRDDRRKVQVFTQLALLIGFELEDPRRADPYIALAQSGIDRIGGDRELRAELLASACPVAYMQGDNQRSVDFAREELQLRELLHGPNHPLVAKALDQLAVALLGLQRMDEGRAQLDRALKVMASTYGETHPDYAIILNDHAKALSDLGQIDQAEAEFRRSLAIMEASFGKRHPDTATASSNVATILFARGQVAEAGAMFKDTLAVEEEVLGPDHPTVATTIVNLAAAQLALGEIALAETGLRRALAIREKNLPAQDSRIAEVQAALGRALIATKRYAEARTLLERAVERLLAVPRATSELAEAQFALAQVLWELNVDRTRAKELAASAEAKVNGTTVADDIARWRQAH